MTDTLIYLDYAAATPLDPSVLAAMQPYFSDQFYNPSATYSAGLAARDSLQAARTQLAACLGSKASEIIFTAGGTEADNLAINGVMQHYPRANLVLSAIEHDAVLVPAASYDHRLAPVNSQGVLDLTKLEALIDDNTVLVSVMYANNEIGTVQPIAKIAQLLARKRASRTTNLPLYFHSDACQAANYLDLHVSRLGVDLLVINGGKVYGPKQSGALFVRGGINLEPQITGGGQERGLRSGTENLAACVGLARSLELAQSKRHSETKRLQQLQSLFFQELQAALPTVVINGSTKTRLPNNVHITISGTDNERLLIQLDERGILAAAGSACSAADEEPSHVLRAIGLSDSDARASLRFTMGQATTEAVIHQTVKVLASLL